MQKFSAKHKWNYRNDSAQQSSEDVKNMVKSLMETQAIDNVASSQLKTENYPSFNPAVIMDLRHKAKHANESFINYKNNNAIKDAKRLIKAEELERRTIERELHTIDTQINSFKKDLECHRLKVHKNFQNKQKNNANKYRQCEASRISLEDTEDILQVTISYNERLFKNKQQVSAGNLIQSFPNSDINFSTSESSSLSFNGNYIKENVHNISDDLSSSALPHENMPMLHNQGLMKKTWNIWRAFIRETKLTNSLQQKMSMTVSNLEAEENKRLLKKFFILWYELSKKRYLLENDIYEKTQQKQKVNKFFENLQKQKHAINSKNKNNFKELKSASVNNISEFSLVADSSRRKENKHNSRILPYHCSNASFRHRFQAQQNIIAEQKAKLEEQKKIIEELQLAQLNNDSEKSEKKTREHLVHTLQNCSTILKPKAKYLCRSMPSAIESVAECKTKQHMVPCLSVQPAFLSRMTERAQERQKRWQLIQQKKKIQKEEKERQEVEKESQRLQEERKMKLEELRKVKIIEKEKETQKQQEKKRLKDLNLKVLEYYRTYLLRKYGIYAFKNLIALRDRNIERADAYCRKTLLYHHFIIWKTYILNYIEWKICKADAFYRILLMKRAFRRFLKIYNDYKVKNQVAVDFYDFNLQKWAFTEWHHVVCLNHIETASKMKKAKLHYERNLITRCLLQWIKLPEVMKREEQRELRKQFWRSKVQELLPDFRSVPSISDSISHHGHFY